MSELRRILSTVRTCHGRRQFQLEPPSYFVMKYLQGKGYRVIRSTPAPPGKEQLGEKLCVMRDIPDSIAMVTCSAASDQSARWLTSHRIAPKWFGCSWVCVTDAAAKKPKPPVSKS